MEEESKEQDSEATDTIRDSIVSYTNPDPDLSDQLPNSDRVARSGNLLEVGAHGNVVDENEDDEDDEEYQRDQEKDDD